MAIARLFQPKIPKVVASSSHPKGGDTIVYEGSPYYLAQHAGKFRIFLHESRRYLELEKQRIIPDPSRPGQWLYDKAKKVTPKLTSPSKTFLAIVTISGEVTEWDVMAESEFKARNKLYGLLAKKLNLTIQGVNSLLHRQGNSVTLKEK